MFKKSAFQNIGSTNRLSSTRTPGARPTIPRIAHFSAHERTRPDSFTFTIVYFHLYVLSLALRPSLKRLFNGCSDILGFDTHRLHQNSVINASNAGEPANRVLDAVALAQQTHITFVQPVIPIQLAQDRWLSL